MKSIYLKAETARRPSRTGRKTTSTSVRNGTLAGRAWEACSRGDWKSAARAAAAALGTDPWSSAPLYPLAVSTRRNGDPRGAATLFRLFLERTPLPHGSDWTKRAAAACHECLSVARAEKRELAPDPSPGSPAEISVVVIVKNDDRGLSRLLRSLAPLVATETIVVDTGSTDGTVAAALAAGANVVEHRWDGDYAAARNAGLDAATQPWILSADSDDCFSPGTAAALRRICADPSSRDYHALRVRLSENLTLFQIRLWRSSTGARFRPKLHERIWPESEPEHHPDIVVDHLDDPEKRTEKIVSRLATLAELVAKEPEKSYWKFHYAVSSAIVGDETGAREAALDYLASQDPFSSQLRPRLYMRYLVAWSDVRGSGDSSAGFRECLELIADAPSAAEYWSLAGDACLLSSRPLGAIAFYEAAERVGSFGPHGPWLVDMTRCSIHPREMTKRAKAALGGEKAFKAALSSERARELAWQWDGRSVPELPGLS